jgi:hypothetical protein
MHILAIDIYQFLLFTLPRNKFTQQQIDTHFVNVALYAKRYKEGLAFTEIQYIPRINYQYTVDDNAFKALVIAAGTKNSGCFQL